MLNKTISKEERIEFIKKNFIQKFLPKYVSYFRDCEDMDVVDEFIIATITENNRIKEKETAIKDFLYRLFLGTTLDSFNLDIDQFKDKAHFNEFIKKYEYYLNPETIIQEYNVNRYSRRNENVNRLFVFLTKRLDLKSQIAVCKANIKFSYEVIAGFYKGLRRKDNTIHAEDLIACEDKELINGLLDFETYKLLAESKTYFSRDGILTRLIYKNDDRSVLPNAFPEIFRTLLENSYENGQNRYSSAPWFAVIDVRTEMETFYNNYIGNLSFENFERINFFKCRPAKVLYSTSCFVNKEIAANSKQQFGGYCSETAENLFKDLYFAKNLFRLFRLKLTDAKDISEEVYEGYRKYLLETYINDYKASEILDSVSNVFSNSFISSQNFKQSFKNLTKGIDVLDYYLSVLDDVLELAKALKMDPEEENEVSINIANIKSCLQLLENL